MTTDEFVKIAAEIEAAQSTLLALADEVGQGLRRDDQVGITLTISGASKRLIEASRLLRELWETDRVRAAELEAKYARLQ